MKKLLRLLLLFVMFVPLLAKADMGAPYFREYKAVVVKEEGASYYSDPEEARKISNLAKDQIITISFELRSDGVDYLMFEKNNHYYYVKASDVMPVEKEVKVTDDNVKKLAEKLKIRVMANEVDVRKGPSVAYDKVGTLKKGTEGTYQYAIPDSAYIYIEADGISGWVETLEEAVLTESNVTLILAKDVKLSCTTVPAGTILKNPMKTDDWSRKVLVEKSGCYELVSNFRDSFFALQLEEEKYYEVIGAVDVFSNPGKKSDISIKKGDYVTVKSEAFYEDGAYDYVYYYADFNGKNVWIRLRNDKVEESIKQVKSIPTKPDKEEEEKEEEEEEEKKKEDKKDDDEDEEEDKGLDTKTIVLICVIVGLSIALAAIVVILLVNKKILSRLKILKDLIIFNMLKI